MTGPVLLPLVLGACTPSDAPQTLEGIDVSHYQKAVDWEKVRAAGISFAFAKASQGTRTGDSTFDENWAGIAAAGLKRGAYEFYDPGLSPAQQASNFSGRVTLVSGDLPPVVDIETMGKSAEDKAALSTDLKTYLDHLEKAYGVKPIIYTSHAFWNAHMTADFGEYPLWIAQYDGEPHIPGGWSGYTFWQYSPKGAVDGVHGEVDRNRFNGSMKELEALAVP